MDEAKVKARLENALCRHITWVEWRLLELGDLVRDYLEGYSVLYWEDLRDLAREKLDRLDEYHRDLSREQSGQDQPDPEPSPDLSERLPDPSTSLSKRTFARATAMSALNRLRAGDNLTPRAMIRGTHKPRGGADGTLPQWVIFLAVEAWVPAEEVEAAYRANQRNLLDERRPPKTQERAFEVARFVWEQDSLNGKRLPWPELCEYWNSLCLTAGPPLERFENWRAFRISFLRGEKATRPRYFASDEQITEHVKERAFERVFDSWASSFRE